MSSFLFEKLRIRPFMESLPSYTPGEQPTEPGFVKLNTNEFPYPAALNVIHAVQKEAADSVRVYPNPTAAPLRKAIAERFGFEPEYIFVGNGSDEVLRLIAQAWLEPGRHLAVVRPTYTLYATLAAQFEAQVDEYPLINETQLPQDLYTSAWDLCFLPVPNPPIGTLFPESDLCQLAEQHDGLLVIDGAYVDFAPQSELWKLVNDYPNVAFSGTFSKSFGLAGMRIGYLIASPFIITMLDKLRDSYNINRVSQAAALGALEASDYYHEKCDAIIKSRERLINDLTQRGFIIPPSQANFIFARPAHGNAKALYEKLKERKVLVRYFSHSGLENGIRITIGTPQEIQTLLETIDAVNHDISPI